MASSTSAGRLVSLTSDNHQPWLWSVHVLTIIIVVWAIFARVRIKWMSKGHTDLLLLAAHLLYFIFWMVLLFALMNNTGKSSRITSVVQETKASKLVLSSRILLVIILTLEKLSIVLLTEEVFTKEVTKRWSLLNTSLILCQLLIGSLIISVGCSPGRTILPRDEGHCPERPARWIIFTVLEAVLDILLINPVIRIVWDLHMNFRKKLWVLAVFISRCVVWVPSIVHLVYFIRYAEHGRDIIDIVPTLVTEEIWACTALILSSIPVLMRLTQRFTTLGVQIADSTITQGSGSKSKGSGSQGMSSFKMANVAKMSGLSSSGQRTALRPEQDDGLNLIQINARVKGEGTSIGSVSESQNGILRKVDFDVSSVNE